MIHTGGVPARGGEELWDTAGGTGRKHRLGNALWMEPAGPRERGRAAAGHFKGTSWLCSGMTSTSPEPAGLLQGLFPAASAGCLFMAGEWEWSGTARKGKDKKGQRKSRGAREADSGVSSPGRAGSHGHVLNPSTASPPGCATHLHVPSRLPAVLLQ